MNFTYFSLGIILLLSSTFQGSNDIVVKISTRDTITTEKANVFVSVNNNGKKRIEISGLQLNCDDSCNDVGNWEILLTKNDTIYNLEYVTGNFDFMKRYIVVKQKQSKIFSICIDFTKLYRVPISNKNYGDYNVCLIFKNEHLNLKSNVLKIKFVPPSS
jgi:hypothetical protein